MSTLAAAVQKFEAAEANLGKLKKLWRNISRLIPTGPAFGSPPEYDELCLAFRRILSALPAVDGTRVEDRLFDYDEAGQMRLDARELGEFEAHVSIENALEEQGKCLREYRFHLNAKRRELVRGRLLELIDEVDGLLQMLFSLTDGTPSNEHVENPHWLRLKEDVAEVATFLGSNPKPPRWTDLQRHLHFGMVGDLVDIHDMIGQPSNAASYPNYTSNMILCQSMLRTWLKSLRPDLRGVSPRS